MEQSNNVQEDTIQPVEKPAPAQVHAINRPKRRPFLIIAALLAGLGGGLLGSWAHNEFTQNESSLTVLKTAQEDGNDVVTQGEQSIAAVAKSVSPSVVSIITSSSQQSPFNGRSIEQEGAGTGMIVSSNGYILTNKHVISDASSVSVVLPGGKTYEDVTVLGSDPLNDVAFLKIKGVTNLPAVTLGDSKTIRIGQTVIAIGNALGQYDNTVTSGIISGKGRPIIASSDGTSEGTMESLTDLIQTDAAINSGNSGGPLLNIRGQVIGLNTAIAQDAQAIGFAIPIGATKGILKHLIKTGKIQRAYLGVQYIPITPAVRKEFDLPIARGDFVYAERGKSVQTGGPADKAGIKDGDIITALNGSNVEEVGSIASLVSEYEVGDKVQVTVLRDGKSVNLTATLGVYKG